MRHGSLLVKEEMMLTTAEYVDQKEQQKKSSFIPANVAGVSSLCIRNGKACWISHWTLFSNILSLMEWLQHSQKKYCELCKTPFQFTKRMFICHFSFTKLY